MLERYADLVAVGTVADVMPLVDENRYLVRQGIRKLKDDPLPGFSAMLREAGVDAVHLTASAISFSLAPRLNAAGRLGQAVKAAELLMCTDEAEAASLAAELCELNRQRQSIETEIWQEAQALLAGQKPDGPIVLASDRWHQGKREGEQGAAGSVILHEMVLLILRSTAYWKLEQFLLHITDQTRNFLKRADVCLPDFTTA